MAKEADEEPSKEVENLVNEWEEGMWLDEGKEQYFVEDNKDDEDDWYG